MRLTLGLLTFILCCSLPVGAKESIPEEKVSLDPIICPDVGQKFIKNSDTTFRSMHDLLDALLEQRTQYSDFFITLLQLDKRIPQQEETASKIVDLKKGTEQKLARAKLNYNEQIKVLASALPKTKKCWGYHNPEVKPKIARLLEIFGQEEFLNEFKQCVQQLDKNNQLFLKKFKLGVNSYNKVTSHGMTLLETKKIDEEIAKAKKTEEKSCHNFGASPRGKFLDYLEGKYDPSPNEPNPTTTVIPHRPPANQNNLIIPQVPKFFK